MKEKIFRTILKYKKTIVVVFSILTALSLIGNQFVEVNYSMQEYLPDDAPSTEAIDVMDQEFEEEDQQVSIMEEDITIAQALERKETFKQAVHVTEVEWLDNVEDLNQPITHMNQEYLDSYYLENNARFVITLGIDDTEERDEAIEDLRERMSEDASMGGELLLDYERDQNTGPDLGLTITSAMVIAFIVLAISTTSWIAPLIILGTIGVAIVINAGTNAFLGEISFVTRDASSILQLGVSIDFSIFLLHRYEEFREQDLEREEAMIEALKHSLGPVASSGITDAIGFAALIVMQYGIGQDMGIVLSKGVLLSLVAVFVLLPAITLLASNIIEKTKHKDFSPDLSPVAKFAFKARYVSAALFFLIVGPFFLAAEENDFYYGESEWLPEDNYVLEEEEAIEEVFGRENIMIAMIPQEDENRAEQLTENLRNLPEISAVESFSDIVGFSIPSDFLPEEQLEEVESDYVRRMVLSSPLPEESDETFEMVETVKQELESLYGEDYYLTGESVVTYDLKEVITQDQQAVNIASILGIFITLLVAYKSISIPIILVLCIQSAIYINLGFPYFQGETLFYIAYLILHSIQLGATVDYAVLLADRYVEEREEPKPKEAVRNSIKKTGVSILTSGTIMTSSGLMLGFFSTNRVPSQIGFLLARGTILSMLIVFFVLPFLLYWSDRFIQKTTWKTDFYKE
jgi:hypothetical protein